MAAVLMVDNINSSDGDGDSGGGGGTGGNHEVQRDDSSLAAGSLTSASKYDVSNGELVGIVTLEDVIEEIFCVELHDEFDRITDNRTKSPLKHTQYSSITDNGRRFGGGGGDENGQNGGGERVGEDGGGDDDGDGGVGGSGNGEPTISEV